MSAWTDKRDAFLAHVEEWFNRLKARIEVLFEASVDAIEQAAEDNKDKIDGDILQFFEETALDAVLAADAVKTGWTDKLAAAVAAVALDFATKGLDVSKHVIVLLVTGALSKLKASETQATGTN